MLLDLYRHTDHNVLASFEVSFHRLEESSPAAAKLLALFAFLDRKFISLELVENFLLDVPFWCHSESFILEPALQHTFWYLAPNLPDYHKNLGILESLCLISRDMKRNTIQIHSQVNESIHLLMGAATAADLLQQVIQL